ncbi:uncharacterized protein LACBIDRAFT_310513 [Laccaria bicolor S238N-H82]|uniref:Predicted protein n=1 Tax=Laccaria bicolor (strain S238N-H82 / ATCC MYA-4686) TaxID=486041 RepID=B0DUI2_LACBS|nr:uncharacterized protein LACBIDRAFT_310513 [Laccaria bicolor S238N-H82]EDR01744.1 predicted protein [Laccaria bicolor S238N-H82]|eukprot:XP_001887557.1 predicted protein [Laccaria bicolor S238N-H82]
MWMLKHRAVCTRLPLSTTLTAAHFDCWSRFLQPPMFTDPGFVFYLLPPLLVVVPIAFIHLSEPFDAWTIDWTFNLEIRRYLGLRECSPILFLLFYISHFWRPLRFRECSHCSLVHCFARGSVLEFRELCEHVQCARYPD